MSRQQTKYPGVFYREAQRIGGPGKEKVYYIVFKRDGKVIEEKAGRQYADGMTAARASLYRAERIENRRPSRKEIREERTSTPWTIGSLWEDYKKNHPGLKGLQKDESRYRHDIKPGFEKKQPCELAPLDIDRLRLTLTKKQAPATVKNILELLRRIINHGIGRSYIEPLKFKIKLPAVNNQVTEDLKPEQMGALLKALDDDLDQAAANLMRLALYTGMRRGELLRLRWEDVDFERGFIRIVGPKGGKDQSIPLNASARAALETQGRYSESPWVFPGRHKGKHAKEMRESISRICTAAKLPKGFRPLHGLRHVYATMLASSGEVDMYTLQKLLTHKSPLMTQRYAHLRDETLKRASGVVDDIVHGFATQAEASGDERQEKSNGTK